MVNLEKKQKYIIFFCCESSIQSDHKHCTWNCNNQRL